MNSTVVGIVLGAQVGPDGAPTPSLRRRTEHAIGLWRAGRVRALILSGGGSPVTEAAVMARLCRAAGVPEDGFVLEPRARTTAQNLRLSLPILHRLGATDVVLISDPYHLPRALLVARRLGLRATGSAPRWRDMAPGVALRMSLREALALAWYWISGKGR